MAQLKCCCLWLFSISLNCQFSSEAKKTKTNTSPQKEQKLISLSVFFSWSWVAELLMHRLIQPSLIFLFGVWFSYIILKKIESVDMDLFQERRLKSVEWVCFPLYYSIAEKIFTGKNFLMRVRPRGKIRARNNVE